MLVESSSLVSLLGGPAACGTTSAGVLGCMAGAELRALGERFQQVAGTWEHHQVMLDSEGVVRCRGNNETGHAASRSACSAPASRSR